MHHVGLMKLIAMYLIDIRPTKIQTRDRPEDELNSYKNAQEAMDSPGVELIIFSHLFYIHSFKADFDFIPS